MGETERIRWQVAADRARVPWPTMVVWMDSGRLEFMVDGFDRLVRLADVDALAAAASPAELEVPRLPPAAYVYDEGGLSRIVPGSLGTR